MQPELLKIQPGHFVACLKRELGMQRSAANFPESIGKKWSELVRLPDMETKEYGYVGCKFAGRCPYVRDICRKVPPPVVVTEDQREVLCFKLIDYQGCQTNEGSCIKRAGKAFTQRAHREKANPTPALPW